MITLGPEADQALKTGVFLHAWCIDFELGTHWQFNNSAINIGPYAANGALGDAEPGVLDGSRSGERRTINLYDQEGILFADLSANWRPGVLVTLSLAFCDPDTYRVLDDTLYPEFSGFIENYEQSSRGRVSLALKSQLALDYVNGRRSNSASIKSQFPGDTSHDHLPTLPKNVKWGSIEV